MRVFFRGNVKNRLLQILLPAALAAASIEARMLTSPDGRLGVTVEVHDVDDASRAAVYAVSFNERPVILPSLLGVALREGGLFRDGLELVSWTESEHDQTWRPVWGVRSEIRDRYRQAVLTLKETSPPGRSMRLTVRAYNEGAAYRYAFPGQDVVVQAEHNEFRFAADHPAWATYHAQGVYEKVPVSRIRPGCERPLTIEATRDLFVSLGEASLVDFARMKFAPLAGTSHALVTRLDGPASLAADADSPWRVIMTADTSGELLENNDLILNLNEPCAIDDTSWIKPGKVIREVTLTTEGARRLVDFAARRKLQYVEFDAGWYGHENNERADASTVTLDPRRSKGPLDLPGVIRYAKDRGIGVLLYVNRRALERQADEVFPLYRAWGVAGVKFGFVNVGSQRWTSWLHEAVRKAAEHHLMVDVHDEYRPTGYSRTWPNLMTQEGILGDEARNRSLSQTLVHLFTRCLAGPADNTFCYFNERVPAVSSHATQLAKSVCLYSPWQFLYWYDRPPAPGEDIKDGLITDEPELAFWDALPTTWDETRVLDARIGEYAAIARRSGSDWFVGVLNAGNPTNITLSLGFLDDGSDYRATIFTDDGSVTTRTQVRVEERPVRASDELTLPLKRVGGATLWIRKDRS